MTIQQKHVCPVCSGDSPLLDVVDFNKSCEEQNGNFLELSGIPIYYALCENCGFCFSPEISAWKPQDFKEKIYNDEYINIDPSYVEKRPRENVTVLFNTFGALPKTVKHLDYGGGEGALTKLLCALGWNSTSYDPYAANGVDIKSMGTFDLITSYEVFEHVPDVNVLMFNLRSLLAPNGVIIFSTLISDGAIQKHGRLSWWYASPRNGHISLFSRKSLLAVAQKHGFNFGSFNDSFHIFCTSLPDWASRIMAAPSP